MITYEQLLKQKQQERAQTQMTLGKMIDVLEKLPPDMDMANLTSPHSYRGYYCDLAFENPNSSQKVGVVLEECKLAMGRTFCGWKGGEFMMGDSTPVWIAERGDCGIKLIDIKEDGSIITSMVDN